MRVLVVNAGSSSLKLSVPDDDGAVPTAMTAATGGLDRLICTGGVGEHSWQVRSAPSATSVSRSIRPGTSP